MAPPAVEVRCAGCGETLEVDHGTTDFACPGCATVQRLPPELMPPPRPRRAIPLSPAGAAQDRVPCGGCGAVLSVPPGLKSFGCPVCAAAARRPQASSRPDSLPAAHPVPPGQEMPRTRIMTRKSVDATRGQSFSRQPAASEENPEEQGKGRQDRGKGPAPTDSENKESSSQAESESESEEAANSDEEMGEAEEQQINLRTITADDYAILRHRNQFVLPMSSTSPKFYTNFQQLVYEQMYGPRRKFADHKFVDWSYLNSLDKYEGTYQLFQRAGIRDLVALRNDYDEELIRQFYATLYISPDFNQISWMTGTQALDCTKHEFELALHTESSSYEKVYDRPVLLVPAWTEYYDQNTRFVPGKIGGLLPIPSLVNRIVNHTILPKSGNFDAIRGHAWNIIDNIMIGRKFDVIDVIIRGIASSKNDRVKRIYYAPYIMALIIRQTGYRGGLGSSHKPYKPREGPPISGDILRQAQQRRQMEDDQREDVPGAAAQEEGQVSLAQIYSVILEIKSTQQEMRTSQQEFQSEIHNRLNTLSESVSALKEVLTTPARFGRRNPRTPLRNPVPASTSRVPPPPRSNCLPSSCHLSSSTTRSS